MKIKKVVITLVVVCIMIFGLTGVASAARDIGYWTNLTMASGKDYTGTVNQHKYDAGTAAIINVQNSDGYFVHQVGAGSAAMYCEVKTSGGAVATYLGLISDNNRYSEAYTGNGGPVGDYKLYFQNTNTFAVNTTGSWSPDLD